MVTARATVGFSSAIDRKHVYVLQQNVGLVIGVQQIRGVRSTEPISRGGNDLAAVEQLRRFPTPSGRRTAVAGTSAFRLMSGYGTEQPVCLAVDPVGEVQDIGAAVVASDPEVDRPEATSLLSARVDRDRPMQLSVARDKGIDLAMEEAEVADQHIIAEPAETGRCDGNPPGGGEAAAGDQFPNEIAVFIKDRHGACP